MTSAATVVKPNTLTGLITARELINTLLDVGPDKTLVMSYQQPNYYAETDGYHMLLVGNRDEGLWNYEYTVWTITYDGTLPYKQTIYGDLPNFPALWGYVTVRELINSLINLDPEDIVSIEGSIYNLSLRKGKVYTRSTHSSHVVNGYSLWSM